MVGLGYITEYEKYSSNHILVYSPYDCNHSNVQSIDLPQHSSQYSWLSWYSRLHPTVRQNKMFHINKFN